MEVFDKRYLLEEVLGKGAFAEVWRVTDTQTNVQMALKIYAPSTGLPVDGIDLLTHEFSIMVNVNHQNLLTPKYFGICDKKPYLALKYCSGGNINNLIGKFSERDAWRLLRDAAAGLGYLHSMTPPIIHQDVKPANILIDDNGLFMLTDFGVSVQSKDTITKATSSHNTTNDLYSAGTLAYMAPERFSSQNKPIMANDIFSLGVTVYELAAGYLPFGNHGGLLLKNGAEVPELPEGRFSKTLSDVLTQCMSLEPAKRPLASQLESMAQQVLQHLPTVRASDTPQNEKPWEMASIVDSHFRKKSGSANQLRRYLIPLAVAAGVLLVGIATWLLWPSANDDKQTTVEQVEATTIQTETPAEQYATDDSQVGELPLPQKESVGQAETATAEKDITTGQTVTSGKSTNSSQTAAPVKTANTSQPVNTEKAAAPQSDASTVATLDLGYATYKGQVVGGKPHGSGTLTFKSAHRIDSYDDEQRTAEAGERVVGTFYRGHIDNGTWHKSNGETEPIIIGH